MAQLNPYLSFDGDAEEALEFYREVFGGELTLSTFGEYGDPGGGAADKIMHGQLVTPDGFVLMGADTPPGMDFAPAAGMNVVISGDEAEKLRGYWVGLSEGATVGTELAKQMWGDEYGDLVDRFGTPWAFNISAGEGPE